MLTFDEETRAALANLGLRFKGLTQIQILSVWEMVSQGEGSVSAAAAHVLLDSRAQPFRISVDEVRCERRGRHSVAIFGQL
jgi:hypothetical protein